MKRLLAATALLVSVTATASAGMLAGGPIYSDGENIVYCEFTNFGTTNITPTSQEIFQNDGSTTPISSGSSCLNGSPVAPNQICFIRPAKAVLYAISCKLTFSEPATNVRGALQLYNSSYESLSTVELR